MDYPRNANLDPQFAILSRIDQDQENKKWEQPAPFAGMTSRDGPGLG